MEATSSPFTVLLRIKGDFERISDAAVIENGDHLFYEKPVGSIVVLEETSHKVLYIMNKDLTQPLSGVDEIKRPREFSDTLNSLDLSFQQRRACDKADFTSDLNSEKQPTVNLESCALSNELHTKPNGVIDPTHARCSTHYPNAVKEFKGDERDFSIGNSFNGNGGQLKFDDVHSTQKRTIKELDCERSNGVDCPKILSHSTPNNLSPQKGAYSNRKLLGDNQNKFITQSSTMVAQVHINENKKQCIDKENGFADDKKCPIFLQNKKSGGDNKPIIVTENGIGGNKISLQPTANISNNCMSANDNEKRVNEGGRINDHLEAQTTDPTLKENHNTNKLGVLPTINMANLTSTLDLSPNWTRPLRRRSTLSTIISTASSSTSNDTKLNPGSINPSILIRQYQSSAKGSSHQKIVCRGDDNLRSDRVMSNEVERKDTNVDKVNFRGYKREVNKKEMDIEDKILQRREMAHLFKWYYPEGGWGWIVLCAAMMSQALCHGVFQLGFSYPMGIIIRKRFGVLRTFQNVPLVEHTDMIGGENDISDMNEGEMPRFINTTRMVLEDNDVFNASENQMSQLQIGKSKLNF